MKRLYTNNSSLQHAADSNQLYPINTATVQCPGQTLLLLNNSSLVFHNHPTSFQKQPKSLSERQAYSNIL